jgi:transglutaminase-like putative cysteine protease
MQNPTMERLAKLVDDPHANGPVPRRPAVQAKHVMGQMKLAEGWFSLILLALIVYSAIWCVQAVGWVMHLSLLTPLAAVGLLTGVIAAKQQRVPRMVLHILAFVLALGLSFWMVTNVDYAGHAVIYLLQLRDWFVLALAGGTSNDDSIFLLFILVLGFLLAYTSSWLLYRTRSPWLVLFANAVVLLINLSYIDVGYVIFLLFFLLAALLLLLRFNLFESSTRWKKQGLRCSDDLNWEFMQAGAMISVGILIFSWFLPWGFQNVEAATIWSSDNNPWIQAQNTWNRVFAVDGGIQQNHGNFTASLTLGGNPNLVNTPVFTVRSDDPSQYLMALSYANYDGHNNWGNSVQDSTEIKAGYSYYDGSTDLKSINQTIYVVNAPGEQSAYIFAASQIAQTDQNVHIQTNRSDSTTTGWLRDLGKLASGETYKVISYISGADVATLQTVPMPQFAPTLPSDPQALPPVTYFAPGILKIYTQVPSTLNASIKQLAFTITANAPTMYDKVTELEKYLRTYTYDSTIQAPPAGQEGINWFLNIEKRGFCNYFASAMVMMARELGIPARVAVGYTNGNGQYDAKSGLYSVLGTNAHAWAQIYFAGYGWINFEPSATFNPFTRPVTSTTSNTGITNASGTPVPSRTRTAGQNVPQETDPGSLGNTNSGNSLAAQVRMDVGIVILVLLVFIIGGLLYFRLWWRKLFRGLSTPRAIYGRVGVLAGWAGMQHPPGQTPTEYMQALVAVAPEEKATFERLGDIYTRERWADPASKDSGDMQASLTLWNSLRPRLVRYVLRHPYFLRLLPGFLGTQLMRPFANRQPGSPIVIEEAID